VKALNGFLMTQRQMTLKGECGCRAYNVSKLHQPRILDAFLADTVDTTRLYSGFVYICDSAVFCALHDQLEPTYR